MGKKSRGGKEADNALPCAWKEEGRNKHYAFGFGRSELPPTCGMKVTFHSVRSKDLGKLKQSPFLPSLIFQPSTPRSFAFLESHRFL